MINKLKQLAISTGATAILTLAVPSLALAAGVTVSADTTMSLPCFSAATLTIVSGSTATSFVVNNTACTFTVTGANGDNFTVNASASMTFENNQNWVTTCQSGSTNTRIVFAPTVASETVVFTPSTRAVSCGSSTVTTTTGGGGGGGATVSPAPTPTLSATNSTVVVDKTTLPADGTAKATATVTVKNSANAVMSGIGVRVTTSRGMTKDTVEPTSAQTNATGVATFLISSSTVGETTISVKVDTSDILLSTQPKITFSTTAVTAEPVVQVKETTPTGVEKTTLSDGTTIEVAATTNIVTITKGATITTLADGDGVRVTGNTGIAGFPAATLFRYHAAMKALHPYADETIYWSYTPICKNSWSNPCPGTFKKLSSGILNALASNITPTASFWPFKVGTVIYYQLSGRAPKYFAIGSDGVYSVPESADVKSKAIKVRPIISSLAYSYNGGDKGNALSLSKVPGF